MGWLRFIVLFSCFDWRSIFAVQCCVCFCSRRTCFPFQSHALIYRNIAYILCFGVFLFTILHRFIRFIIFVVINDREVLSLCFEFAKRSIGRYCRRLLKGVSSAHYLWFLTCLIFWYVYCVKSWIKLFRVLQEGVRFPNFLLFLVSFFLIQKRNPRNVVLL